jgi:hypothetical protein
MHCPLQFSDVLLSSGLCGIFLSPFSLFISLRTLRLCEKLFLICLQRPFESGFRRHYGTDRTAEAGT